MVCWYKCWPCIFKRDTPKRLLYKWDIVAMILLTVHDVINFVFSIVGTAFHPLEMKHDRQYPPYQAEASPPLTFIVLCSNIIIIYLVLENGFSLLEDGPWYGSGKVILAMIHVIPAIGYIATVRTNFIYFMGIHAIDEPPKRYKEVHDTYGMTWADIYQEVFGFSIFHHLYIVLFEVIVTICIVLCCSPKDTRNPATLEELLVAENSVEASHSGSKNVVLQLDAPNRIFNAGDEVKGEVLLKGLPEEDASKAIISVGFVGQHIFKWKKSRCCQSSIPFDATETTIPLEFKDGPQFSFPIPADAKPSFFFMDDSKHVAISYVIHAKVTAPGIPETILELPIVVSATPTVTSPFPADPVPKKFHKDYRLCFLMGFIPTKNGTFGCDFSIPKTSFVVGETIPFVAKMWNDTRRPVMKVTATLLSRGFFVDSVNHSPAQRLETTIIWNEVARGPLTSGCKAVWDGSLTIPPTVPESSSLALTKAIQLESFIFRFLMEIRGLSEDVILEIPVIIGAEPDDKNKVASDATVVTVDSEATGPSTPGTP